MNEICIHVPSLRENQTVDVEVTINGEKQLMNYRVESIDWTRGGRDITSRIAYLRSRINGYDEGWQLIQIGIPDGDVVPVMFRRREGIMT
jgi:hypothetical protein